MKFDARAPYARGFRPLLSGVVPGISTRRSAPPCFIEIPGSYPIQQVRAFSPVDGPTMPSADSSPTFPPPLGNGSPWGSETRSPRVMRPHLPAHPPLRALADRTFPAEHGGNGAVGSAREGAAQGDGAGLRRRMERGRPRRRSESKTVTVVSVSTRELSVIKVVFTKTSSGANGSAIVPRAYRKHVWRKRRY